MRSLVRSPDTRPPWAWLAALLLPLLWAVPLAAQEPQPEPEAEAPPAPVVVEEPAPGPGLLEHLESDFRVLKLRSGLVLEPKSDLGGIDTIELSPEGYAIDGAPVTAAELAARLGSAADPVLAVGELPAEELKALIAGTETGVLAISEAEPEVESRAPRPPRPRRPPRPSRSDDAEVVFGSDLTVGPGETTRDVVVFGGDLTIEGQVLGDAVAIGGEARVDGEITGDLAIVGGSARIGPSAVIHGEVVNVGGSIDLDDDAVVHGQVVDIPFGPSFTFNMWRPHGVWGGDWWRHGSWGRPFGRVVEFIWEVIGLAVLVLLACLALLLARRPVDRIGRRVAAEPWKAGLVGLLSQLLFIPLLILVILILTISIIGIPLLLLVPFALLGLILLAFLGYTAVAFRLGLWARRRFGWGLPNPYLVLLVGIGVVEIWSLFGEGLQIGGGPLYFLTVIFLVLGGMLQYVVWTVGFGGALLTRFGTADGWERAPAVAPAAPPPPPPPAELPSPPAEPAAPPPDESFWEGDEEERPERPKE